MESPSTLTKTQIEEAMAAVLLARAKEEEHDAKTFWDYLNDILCWGKERVCDPNSHLIAVGLI